MANAVQRYGNGIHLLPDEGSANICCLKDLKPEIDDRKIAVWHLSAEIAITYERYPNATWWEKFFCCFNCAFLPTTVGAVQTLANYIIQKHGQLALRIGQLLSKIDLSTKETLLVSERKKLLLAVLEGEKTQKKIEMMWFQIKYSLMLSRIDQLTPPPHNRLIAHSNDDREILIEKAKKLTCFSAKRLLNVLKSIHIIRRNESKWERVIPKALEDIINDVRAAIFSDSQNANVIISSSKLTEYVVKELKVREFQIAEPLIYKYIPAGQRGQRIDSSPLTLSDENLLKLHNDFNQPKTIATDEKVDT